MKLGKYIRKTWGSLFYKWLDKRLPKTGVATQGVTLPQQESSLPCRLDVPLLFFAAADAEYFERFGRAFIGSLLTNAPGSAIHIHLFNPESIQLKQLEALAASSIPHLSFSWEKINLDHLDGERRGRYYYSVRFVRLAEVVAKVGAPCMCLDIDALLVGPIEKLMAKVGDAEVAFYARFDKHGGNTKLLAGTLYTYPTAKVINLLNAIGMQIQRFIEHGYLLEKLDQLVIYDFFMRAMRGTPDLRFYAFDESVIDLRFTNQGLIWYPKGASKDDKAYCSRMQNYEMVFARHEDEIS